MKGYVKLTPAIVEDLREQVPKIVQHMKKKKNLVKSVATECKGTKKKKFFWVFPYKVETFNKQKFKLLLDSPFGYGWLQFYNEWYYSYEKTYTGEAVLKLRDLLNGGEDIKVDNDIAKHIPTILDWEEES